MKKINRAASTIPYQFVIGLAICMYLFGHEVLKLSRHNTFLEMPKGYIIAGMIGIILLFEVIYWSVKKTRYRLFPILIILHWAVTLFSMGFFLAAVILFRQQSILGSPLFDTSPSVVAYPAMTRPAFYFVVAQFILVINLLVTLLTNRKNSDIQ